MITLFGAGALGGRVAQRLPRPLRVVTRTQARHDALRVAGCAPTTAWPTLGEDERVVLCLPGSAAQQQAVERLAAAGLAPARAVLVSTTGYHAPYRGRVGPDSPPGEGPRAAAAAAAEASFRAWAGDGGVIVRLGGLYSATRGPAHAFARTGTARLAPPDARLPLIHDDDAARLIAAALLEPSPPAVLLGVTSSPTRATFYDELAARLGVEPPPFAAPMGQDATFACDGAARLLPDPEHLDWRASLPTR